MTDTSIDNDQEFEEVEEHAECDGCGIQDSTVYSDGFGFNICGHGCNSYNVRGLNSRDFY